MSNQNVGHLATLAFGSSSYNSKIKITQMTIGGVAVARVPTTHLGLAAPATNVMGNDTAIPGKVHRLASIRATVQFDPTAGNLPPIGTIETMTLTFGGDLNTWSGSGWIGEQGDIQITSDGLVECELTIERTGGWTAA